jgi:prepilin-type N-terminal cleavage/methylation domain-containing protein
MNKTASRKSAFTILELLIVLGIIGLCAALAVPNFVRASSVSQKNACINNLYQIRAAIGQWTIETRAQAGATVQYSDICAYLRNTVACPAGGTSFSDSYTITDNQTQPVCKKVPAGAQAHILPPDVTQ